MSTFFQYIAPLAFAATLISGGNVFGQMSEQVLKEAITLWPLAGNSGDPFTEEEHRILEEKWKRIAEIGEEAMSRALLVFYRQKAGSERPFSFKTSILPADPDWEQYTFETDSREKGLMAAILVNDPRRTAEFLPVLRDRMQWLIKHVPADKHPAEIAVNEVASSAQYMLVRGTAEDKKLVSDLRAAYEKLQNPFGAQKVEAIDVNTQNIEHIIRDVNQARLPFAFSFSPAADPGQKTKKQTDGDADLNSGEKRLAQHDARNGVNLKSSNDQNRSWLVGLLVIVAATIGAAWMLLRKRK